MPTMPIPPGETFDENVMGKGDAERGRALFSRSSCIGCHAINGNPASLGTVGPNLTHVGTRYTIAGGLYPNDTKHLSYWIKNAPHLKPGSIMPTIGKGHVRSGPQEYGHGGRSHRRRDRRHRRVPAGSQVIAQYSRTD